MTDNQRQNGSNKIKEFLFNLRCLNILLSGRMIKSRIQNNKKKKLINQQWNIHNKQLDMTLCLLKINMISKITLMQQLIHNIPGKLMFQAVRLLKPNGTLVYSTCTITLAENEGMVAWTLKTFKNITLETPKYAFGEMGWPGTTLTDLELKKLQRFGPNAQCDSVGFFYCIFRKKPTEN